MKMRGPGSATLHPTTLKIVEAMDGDPDSWLRICSLSAKIRSPYYAWMALDICIKHKKAFPDWLTAYLVQTAERMLSKEAKQARDLRKTLLWILDFPKKKNGPGKLLDPDHGRHTRTQKMAFALNFAVRVYQGEDPPEARGNACSDVFGKRGPEDRTLQRYLREELRLTNLPATVEEWKAVTDRYYDAMLTFIRELAIPDN